MQRVSMNAILTANSAAASRFCACTPCGKRQSNPIIASFVIMAPPGFGVVVDCEAKHIAASDVRRPQPPCGAGLLRRFKWFYLFRRHAKIRYRRIVPKRMEG